MRRSRYTDNPIMAILWQNEDGAKVAGLCREHGFSTEASTEAERRSGELLVCRVRDARGIEYRDDIALFSSVSVAGD